MIKLEFHTMWVLQQKELKFFEFSLKLRVYSEEILDNLLVAAYLHH